MKDDSATLIDMIPHLSFSPRQIRLVAVTAIALACPQLSEAKCHASDFDPSQIQTILKEVEGPVENMAALMRSAPTAANVQAMDLVMLMGAARNVKGDGKIVAYFMTLLLIRSDMATPADRRTVDDFIGMESTLIYRDLQTDGDALTQIPPGGWGYGKDEIKDARDVMRKMQALFACAAEDK